MKKILTLFVFVAIIGYFYYSSYHHTRECVGKHCMTSSVPESCYLKSKNFRTETFDPRKRFAFEVERSFNSLEMIDAHTNRTVGRASIQGPDTAGKTVVVPQKRLRDSVGAVRAAEASEEAKAEVFKTALDAATKVQASTQRG